MNLKYSVKEIVEASMLVALAVVLDLPGLKIPVGTGGGSISFTMVPLFVLAYRQGFLKGFVGIGIVYSLITWRLDGWGIEALPFDYVLGYGSIAVSGLFSKLVIKDKITVKSTIFLLISVVFALFLRFAFACISSLLIYKVSFVAALIYNVAYLGPSTLLTIGLLLILYKPLCLICEKFPLKSID